MTSFRALFLFRCCCLCGLVTSCKAAPGWEAARSQHLCSLGADLLFFDVPELPKRGPSQLVVLRFEGPVKAVPHHFRDHKLSGPQGIEAWAETVRAPVLINAGQFDDQQQHIGWLKAEGQWLSRVRKPQWMGLLVSGPLVSALPAARIVDLATVAPSIIDRYQNVVQSMMLIDEEAHVRVRDTDHAASRTLLAEDTRGRLLVIASQGAIPLAAFARWLPTSGLEIVRAMNLDGGRESQLALRTPERQLTLLGEYGGGGMLVDGKARMVRALLPAVVAITPVPSQGSPSACKERTHGTF